MDCMPFYLKLFVAVFFLGSCGPDETVPEGSQIGSENTCLQSGEKPWANERPDWLFDGERLVFGSKRDGNWELYTMNPDGSHQTRLTDTPESEIFPSVSWDGKRIAFVGTTEGNYDIFVMKADGTNRQRLTTDEKIDDWPSWTEADRQIIFDSERQGKWDIFIMDANSGGNLSVLIESDGKDVEATSSKAGSLIIFRRDQHEESQLYAFDPLTGKETQLTNSPFSKAAPDISPDGTKIVFNAGEDFWNIYTMNIDGTGLTRLTEDDYDDKWATWSPDGSKIAFGSNRNGNWDIYVMDNDGKNLKRLTFGSEGCS